MGPVIIALAVVLCMAYLTWQLVTRDLAKDYDGSEQ